MLTPCDVYDQFLPALFKPLQFARPRARRAARRRGPLKPSSARRLPIAFGWLMKRPIDPA